MTSLRFCRSAAGAILKITPEIQEAAIGCPKRPFPAVTRSLPFGEQDIPVKTSPRDILRKSSGFPPAVAVVPRLISKRRHEERRLVAGGGAVDVSI